MVKDYYIFDDVISNEEQILLYDYVKNSNIKWSSLENITGGYGGKNHTRNFPAKVHPQIFCNNEDIKTIIDSIQPIVAKKLNLEFIKNYRWKINWTTPLSDVYDPMDLLHCDTIVDHIAMVYYINDSTGDTCIYKNVNGDDAKTYQENFNNVDYKSYSLLANVSPKMGRCVVFNGKLAHHGNYPLIGDRFIINFNFAAKSKNIKNIL